MKTEDCGGYEIHLPTSGGKAGKGRAISSTLQVRLHNCIKKQFRFSLIDNGESRRKALKKATDYITSELRQKKTENPAGKPSSPVIA